MKRVAGREKVGQKPRSRLKSRLYVVWLLLVCVGIVSAMAFMAPAEPAASGGGGAPAVHSNGWFVGGVLLFEPLKGEKFNNWEKLALCLNVVVALGGLAYALTLVNQVMKADKGTKKMQEIAQAVREGANAYLYRQFSVVGVLIVIITVLLFFGARASHNLPEAFWWGGRLPSLSVPPSRPRSVLSA